MDTPPAPRDNASPVIYVEDDDFQFDHDVAEEVYASVRSIQDPEWPYTLAQLRVVQPGRIRVSQPDGRQRGGDGGETDCGDDRQGGETCVPGAAPKSRVGAASANTSASEGAAEREEKKKRGGKASSSARAGPRSLCGVPEVTIELVPTVPACSMAALIGLCVRERLTTDFAQTVRVRVEVAPSAHNDALALTRQLNDKERVAGALENSDIRRLVHKCTAETEWAF